MCLGLFGPKSRDLMEVISGDNFSNDKLKFGNSKNILIENKEFGFKDYLM